MGEIDVKIIKRTQETLGKIIKKPVLTEKLLSRPPFRFLHDICTSVIRSTGLMKGLFNSEELEADNVKDKDKKLAFLQKLVDFLTVVHERTIPVRIMSIVAGKEAEKTNEMLYLLAEAVNKKINNEEYVARVLQGRKVDDVKASIVGKEVSEIKHPKKKPGTESNPVGHRAKLTQSRQKYKLNGVKVNELEKPFVDNNKYPVNLENCDNARENHMIQDSGSPAGNHCGLQTLEKSQEEIVAPSLQNSETSVFQPRLHRPASAKGQRVKKDGSCLTSEVKNWVNHPLLIGDNKLMQWLISDYPKLQ
ncbi:putative traf3ip1 protein [Schistosoma mansoni]|uniref:putative traf3ip1 protein n=1 Tax=Schistosoma mansoni TaxID=6183 RepID=UPI00019B3841|nr:putative traf3ip1 protein [Schistosoma mansoni]|eukprot:XP_018648276.1 putative traf3ip1 protein [Schistosoma mansoni]